MLTAKNYLPLHHRTKKYALKIPFRRFAWITVSLPLFSFIFCVMWSILFQFEKTTRTHCQVANVLPSISAAIGSFAPQRHVWRIAIALHSLPRFLVANMYFRYYQNVLYPRKLCFAKIACGLNVIENLALIGLTFVSSSENYAVHEKCFITFMVTSEVYMVVTCYIQKRLRKNPPDNMEAYSLNVKIKLLMVNIISFGMSGYFFLRHNLRCEPYIYSLFALCEYIVVLTNMGFHMTASWDFYDQALYFRREGMQFN